MKKIIIALLVGGMVLHVGANTPPQDREKAPQNRSYLRAMGWGAAAIGSFTVARHAAGALCHTLPLQIKKAREFKPRIITFAAWDAVLVSCAAAGIYYGGKMAYWSYKSLQNKPS